MKRKDKNSRDRVIPAAKRPEYWRKKNLRERQREREKERERECRKQLQVERIGREEQRKREDGGRNGDEQEQVHRGVGLSPREPGAQLPLDSPQLRPRRHIRHRRPLPRLQGHRP